MKPQKKDYGMFTLSRKDLETLGIFRKVGDTYYRKDDKGKFIKIDHVTAQGS